MALRQSFLPVITDLGVIKGLYAITPTNFSGLETSFNLSRGSVPVQKQTLKASTLLQPRLSTFMASVWDHTPSVLRQYEQFAEWIPIDYIMPSSMWTQSTIGARKDSFDGVMMTCLKTGFTTQIGAAITTPPSLGNVSPTLQLKANTPFANVDGPVFFDFNWVDLFAANFPSKTPASIQVTGQPGAADLLAYVIMGGQPVAGQITQNTIRIVKVIRGNIATGARVFTFRVFDQSEATPFPAISVITSTTGGSLGAATYTYRVSAIIGGIESICSAGVAITTTGASSRNTISWPLIPGATGYNVFGRTTNKKFTLSPLGAAVSSFTDDGSQTLTGADPISQNFTDVTLTATVS